MQLPLKKGSYGPDVVELQNRLNKLGYSLSKDGQFGNSTEKAVLDFQRKNSLVDDGIVGQQTWNTLVSKTDSANTGDIIVPESGSPIHIIKELSAGEYVKEKTVKRGFALHHTVSDGDPEMVLNNWEHDTRGAVATPFIIGREMVNGNKEHDGKIMQVFDMDFWAHHIKTDRMGFDWNHNVMTNKSYIGVELCSWGCLKKVGTKFYDLSGKIQIPEYQVCILKKPFRTYEFWHKFTDAQLHSLYELAKYVSKKTGINFEDLTYEPETVDFQWFEMDWNAMSAGYGHSKVRKLTTHTNFEYGKFDTFPQPELIEVIKMIRGGK